jgi:hypothetical protein
VKQELNKDMESLEKKELNRNLGNKNSLSQIKNIVEIHSYSHRLEKVEDRNLEHEDKYILKKKAEEYLDKRLKS